MWHSIIKTDQPDGHNDQLSLEALHTMFEQMQRAALAGEQLQVLVNRAIDTVPTRLYQLISDGRATFMPTCDAQGHLIEISIVPVERMKE